MSVRTCEELWDAAKQLVQSEKCNYYTCSNQMSEHCYKTRCNHRKEDCSHSSHKIAFVFSRAQRVLINLLGVLKAH